MDKAINNLRRIIRKHTYFCSRNARIQLFCDGWRTGNSSSRTAYYVRGNGRSDAASRRGCTSAVRSSGRIRKRCNVLRSNRIDWSECSHHCSGSGTTKKLLADDVQLCVNLDNLHARYDLWTPSLVATKGRKK